MHIILDRHLHFSRGGTKCPTTLEIEFVVKIIVAGFLDSPLNQQRLL